MTTVRAQLCLLSGDEVIHVEPVGPRGVRLGRAPGNDLALVHAGVAAHHATVEWDGPALVLTDLGSDFGTTVAGRTVSGQVVVGDGDEIVLGGQVHFRVRVRTQPPPPAWALEVDGLVRVPVRRDRIRLGGGIGDDLLLPGAPAAAAMLYLVGEEVRLATDDDDVAMAVDVPVPFAGTTLVLRRADPEDPPAAPIARTPYRYHLSAALGGRTGPFAVLSDPATRREHRAEDGPRTVLLWVLGRRWRDDEGHSAGSRGWCADEEVLGALWGAETPPVEPARLRTLVCRLRRALIDAGLDGGCLERREGFVRLRLASVALAP